MLADAKRAAELEMLAQIDKFIGWLGRHERTRPLADAAATLRRCLTEEEKVESTIRVALLQLQTYIIKIRSRSIRKLLKVAVEALCHSREVAVVWEPDASSRRQARKP